MFEPTRAAAWIDSVLRGSAVLPGLGIANPDKQIFRSNSYGDTPPELFINYQLQTPEEDFSLLRRHDERLWSPQLWLITVTQMTRTLDIVTPIADEIDNLFNRPSRDGLPSTIQASNRVRPFMQPTLENGRRYERLGGLYKLLVRVPQS
jgi:hypothetical protein